jgi:hypothetical protein
LTDEVGIPSISVARARTSLDQARRDLDDAVRSISERDDETVMANAGLVALLLEVVSARRHLEHAERPPGASLPASLR